VDYHNDDKQAFRLELDQSEFPTKLYAPVSMDRVYFLWYEFFRILTCDEFQSTANNVQGGACAPGLAHSCRFLTKNIVR